MGIRLIVDSCCDTTPEIRVAVGLTAIAPLKVKIGSSRQVIDTVDVDTKQLIADMAASKEAATSACPAPEEYAELMRGGGDCLVITLSSKLSGSYNAARVARDMLREQDPEQRIHIFDSKSASAGELLLLLYLHDCLQAGDDYDELVRKGEERIAAMRTLFVLEDLGNFVKNGRLSKVSGIVASILSLCPIMGDDGNGEVKMVAKCRGNQNALNRLVEITAKHMEGYPPKSVRLTLTYCNCPERADRLRAQLLAACPAVREIVMAPTGALSTMYASDGGIVIAF